MPASAMSKKVGREILEAFRQLGKPATQLPIPVALIADIQSAQS